MINLFVYGTLLVPKIWEAVTRTPFPDAFPAQLTGYSIFRVRNADYPGMVESTPEATVPGRVILAVPDDAVSRLDAYEDSFYERRKVMVFAENLGKLAADAYCIRTDEAAAILSLEPWTIEWFEESALKRFWSGSFGG